MRRTIPPNVSFYTHTPLFKKYLVLASDLLLLILSIDYIKNSRKRLKKFEDDSMEYEQEEEIEKRLSAATSLSSLASKLKIHLSTSQFSGFCPSQLSAASLSQRSLSQHSTLNLPVEPRSSKQELVM